jgi:uncharacterized protein (DUF58 family)
VSVSLPPETEALLRRLEYIVRVKLDGLLQGNYLGLVPGPGTEPGESRAYTPGDDVRRMDWPVTARTMTPHVRQSIVDRELETWLVIDLTPSLDLGTGRLEKRDLVLAAATAISHLSAKSGNRLGAIVSTGDRIVRIPARGGTNHARQLLRQIAGIERGQPGSGIAGSPLGIALEQLRRPVRRRGMVVVVSDFIGDPAWQRALRALGNRHELLAVEIVDPLDLELPAAGLLTFMDAETGGQLEVQTADPKVRARYAAAAAGQRAEIATVLRRAGAAHLRLRTDSDWISDIVTFVTGRRRGVRSHAVTAPSTRVGAGR